MSDSNIDRFLGTRELGCHNHCDIRVLTTIRLMHIILSFKSQLVTRQAYSFAVS